MRLKHFLTLGCLLPILASAAHADTWRSFLDKDSAEISFSSVAFQISEEAARILENRTAATGRYLSLIGQMGDQFAERVSPDDTPQDKIRKLNDFFFKEHGFTADAQPDADKMVENVLLEHVLDNKRGVCMSLSMIYMQIAQRAGIKLSGVSVPLHFFLRYDGEEPFNIETLDGGRTDLTDAFYREKYFVEDWEPFYMESLDAKKMLAVFAANIASIMTQNGMPNEAVAWLVPLQDALKDDVEVKTNLGNAYLMTGDQDQAMQWWLKAVEYNYRDDKAHFSLAQAYNRTKDYQKAIHHYDQALLLGHEVDFSLLRALEWHREDSYYSKDSEDGKSQKEKKHETHEHR